ncbi:MAG: host-nuclease inhibitor Gam family protein [Candidatus Aminicenantes bacterium]|nr:host-nuclease inhibitor Gam family protein [Candidatus Aminicenantes bacterium]
MQVIKSMDDVGKNVTRLSELKAQKKSAEAPFKADISEQKASMKAVEAKMKSVTVPAEIEMEQIDQNIRVFAINNWEEFRTDKAKSVKFEHGTVKTKELEEVEYPEDDDLVLLLRKVLGKQAEKFIFKKEVPSRQAIKTLVKTSDDNALAGKLGISYETTYDIKVTTH